MWANFKKCFCGIPQHVWIATSRHRGDQVPQGKLHCWYWHHPRQSIDCVNSGSGHRVKILYRQQVLSADQRHIEITTVVVERTTKGGHRKTQYMGTSSDKTKKQGQTVDLNYNLGKYC